MLIEGVGGEDEKVVVDVRQWKVDEGVFLVRNGR